MPRQISLVSGGCLHNSDPIEPIHAQSSIGLPVQFLPWLPSSIIHACSPDHFTVVVVIFRLTHACWGWLGDGEGSACSLWLGGGEGDGGGAGGAGSTVTEPSTPVKSTK